MNIAIMHSSSIINEKVSHTRDSEAVGLKELINHKTLNHAEIVNYLNDDNGTFDFLFLFIVGNVDDRVNDFLSQNDSIKLVLITQDPNWSVNLENLKYTKAAFLISPYRTHLNKQYLDYIDFSDIKVIYRSYSFLPFGAITDYWNKDKVTQTDNETEKLEKAVYLGSLKKDRKDYFKSINNKIANKLKVDLFGHFTKEQFEKLIGEKANENIIFKGRTKTPFEAIDLYKKYKYSILMPDDKMNINQVEYARMHELNIGATEVMYLYDSLNPNADLNDLNIKSFAATEYGALIELNRNDKMLQDRMNNNIEQFVYCLNYILNRLNNLKILN